MEHASKGKFWNGWDGLQKYNFVLFVVHAILAIVFTIYFNRKDLTQSKVNLSLYNHVFKLDSTENVFNVISQEAYTWPELGIGNLIVTFFAITAGFHLLYAFNPGDIYLSGIKRGHNYIRWIEYSITATLMIVIIAALSGVKDIKAYFLLVTSAFAMIWTGYWFETSPLGSARWIPIFIGFVLLFGIVLTIWTSFHDRLSDVQEAGYNIPSWLWVTVIIMFLFYSSFGFVPIAQQLWKGDFRKYEYVYLSLSLAAKATLGMLVAYGFGQRAAAEQPS
uniref:Uncharacterized protein n=1 Tax=viral metagenome TaxID=1070528 RepID=A0A6C0CGH8_9ZZZZ